jgi:hypothetical protein
VARVKAAGPNQVPGLNLKVSQAMNKQLNTKTENINQMKYPPYTLNIKRVKLYTKNHNKKMKLYFIKKNKKKVSRNLSLISGKGLTLK